MAIDRADWHYGGDFPEELSDENGGTHIGMYITWIIDNHLEGELHHEDADSEAELERVRKREMTGTEFLFSACDEKFWESDLNEEGLAFTNHYYVGENDNSLYYSDYEEKLVNDLPTLYHVEDTWENYDKLRPVLDQRFLEWKNK